MKPDRETTQPIETTHTQNLIADGVGARYWLDPAENGPEGWGFRAQFTLLFPRK